MLIADKSKLPPCVDFSYMKRYKNFSITPYSIETLFMPQCTPSVEILWVRSPFSLTLFYQLAFRELNPETTMWKKAPNNMLVTGKTKWSNYVFYSERGWKAISEKEYFAISLQCPEIRESLQMLKTWYCQKQY